MVDPRTETLTRYLRRSCETLERAASDRDLFDCIIAIADRITQTFRDGGKVLLAGNGGSASDAQHIAGEFLGRFKLERNPLPAIALTTDTSILTAIGNDYGFDGVFERQIRGLGRPGDVFIAYSTSGRSTNVLTALRAARQIGMINIGFTGSGGDMRTLCDLVYAAPSDETSVVQQIHIVAAHAVCLLVERDLFAPPA